MFGYIKKKLKYIDSKVFYYRAKMLSKLTKSLYQPLPWCNLSANASQRDRCFSRLNPIVEVLGENKFSVLDIGCNVGFYSFKLAERGNNCIGIDHSPIAIAIGESCKIYSGIKNVAFFECEVNPNNITLLPGSDVVLLLSVFHHWVHFYGFETAENMLNTLWKKTGKYLFFETGQSDYLGESRHYAKDMPNMGKDPKIWLEKFLSKLGNNKVNCLGQCPQTGRNLMLVTKMY